MRSGWPPTIIEIDQEPTVLSIDHARDQRLQHVSAERRSRLRGQFAIRHDQLARLIIFAHQSILRTAGRQHLTDEAEGGSTSTPHGPQ